MVNRVTGVAYELEINGPEFKKVVAADNEAHTVLSIPHQQLKYHCLLIDINQS